LDLRKNRYLAPLLSLLLVGGTAAVPTSEELYRQAHAENVRGDSAKAGVIADEALKRYSNSDDISVWRLRAIKATSLTNSGDYKGAHKLLQRPFPKSLLRTEADLERLEALSYVLRRLSDPAAVTNVVRAHELAKEKYPQKLVRVLVLRAVVDPEKAEYWAGEALRIAKKYPDPAAEVRAYGTLARVRANDDRFDEAITMWEAGLRRKITNQSTVEKLQGNLGWAYLELGDYENAAVFFSAAHTLATRIGQTADAVIWTYQLGNVRFRQGDLTGAEQQYRTALDLATKTDQRQRGVGLSLLANYELRIGRLAEAQRHIDEAIRAVRIEKNVDDELRSMVIAGHIFAATSQFAEGERVLNEVLTRATSIATLSEAHGRLAQLFEKKRNDAEADKHYRESIAKAREARASVDDQELRFAYFTSVAELMDSYVDFLVARGRNADALAMTELSRAQALEDALPERVTTRDARIVARDAGATILCYWLGGRRSYLWIVTPKELKVVRLPPQSTIEPLIDSYQRVLLGARGSLSMSSARGIELWEQLVAPASPFIARGSRVIIVPHGRLAAFNLETLVVPKPNPHYWIEDAVISTSGSISLLARKEPKRPATSQLLLVGNPPPPSSEFVALPRAGEEMEYVARHFDRKRTRVLSDKNATVSAYLAASPQSFEFLHFVAHGVPTRLKPLDSAVVLAREGDTFKLYARDIAKQSLAARLVTISSCHGAGTRAYSGEGLVGLGWAFLRAGADNVVAALWEVNDDATPKLMDRFYGELEKGVDPATALRNAKLSLVRSEGADSWPLRWAPFLLYGKS
jgi:CHAT domain-containing protein/Tfp pilus assembly protein PilF